MKLEKNGFQCRMPQFLRFIAAFIGLTYVDTIEYGKWYMDKFTVPALYVCPKAFGGYVVATYAGEYRHMCGEMKDGTYLYSFYHNGYLELDEDLSHLMKTHEGSGNYTGLIMKK